MGKDNGLPQQDDASMAYYKLGYAFYDPQSSLDLKPSACGYITEDGSFHAIVQIDKAKATKKGGYTPIDRSALVELRPSKRWWGPKYTETVEHKQVGISAGTTALPTGIPLDVSGLLEFTTDSDFGAVLLCESEVSKQGYDHAEPFRKWIRANAEKLLANFPKDIKDYGLYVVLATHTTKEALVNAWQSKSHQITLGFKGTADPIGDVTASTEFFGASSASGWTRTSRDESSGEEKVVFFTGLKYEYKSLTGWMRSAGNKLDEVPQEKWRGDNFIVQDPEVPEDALEIVEVKVGDLKAEW